MTLRDVVYGNPPHIRLTDVADPGVVLDMDTPADYQAMLDLLKPLKPETASNVTRENILRLVDMK